MDSISKDTLTDLVKQADPLLNVSDEVALYNATLMYLFRGFNYRTYGARVAKLTEVKPNVRAITDAMSRSGSVVKNLKVWVFYVVKHKLDYKASLKLARKWDVSLRDVRAFGRIHRTVLAHLRKLAKQFNALTLEKLDGNIVSIMNETKTWMGKFVSRKLRFVIQSQGLHRNDIEHELVFKGIQGLLMMYPCVQTYLHATNVVKRVIHNQGINMIHHYTTQKVGRLQVDGAGAFHSKVISLDEAQLNTIVAPETSNDLKIELGRALTKYSGKRRRFIELICGAYCPEFTTFLAETGYKLDTNEELLDKLPSKDYMALALQHLNVSIKSGQAFLKELRAQFAPYSVNAA